MSSLNTPKFTNWNKIYSGKWQKNSFIISVTSETFKSHLYMYFKIWNCNVELSFIFQYFTDDKLDDRLYDILKVVR